MRPLKRAIQTAIENLSSAASSKATYPGSAIKADWEDGELVFSSQRKRDGNWRLFCAEIPGTDGMGIKNGSHIIGTVRFARRAAREVVVNGMS